MPMGMSPARVAALLRKRIAFLIYCLSCGDQRAVPPWVHVNRGRLLVQNLAEDPIARRFVVGTDAIGRLWLVTRCFYRMGKVLLWSDGNNVQLWDPTLAT